MDIHKINLDGNINAIKLNARLYTILKSLPDITKDSFRSEAETLVLLNFESSQMDQVQGNFILFAIGKPSIFDKSLKV